jgi:hypothetical protein
MRDKITNIYVYIYKIVDVHQATMINTCKKREAKVTKFERRYLCQLVYMYLLIYFGTSAYDKKSLMTMYKHRNM